MCGLAGFFSRTTEINQETIEQMTCAVAHRGPDAQGIFLNEQGTTALGHRRLSVLDLSIAANQPMHSADGRYVIVFNGEIYNFKKIRSDLEQEGCTFRTESDTEVLLVAFHRWGIQKMLSALEGMFVFAIYDQHEKKLWLSRDRVGKKPLYYYADKEVFIFASEIKALLKHPLISNSKEINETAVNYFLHLGYIPEPHTIFTHIHKFPASGWTCIDHTISLNIQPFWKVEQEVVAEKIHDASQAKNKLKEILQGAVNRRLMSDVPVGAFLSGGTDSSLIAALASQHMKMPLKTFNIGFSESKFNESAYAKAVANHLKTEHQEYILSEKEGVALLDTYLQHFDEPFADTSAIPTMLVSKLARKEVTVALTGDGGDELFQGYGSYSWANRLSSPVWAMARKPLQALFSISDNNRLERVSQLLANDYGNQFSHIFSQEQGFFSQQELKNKLFTDKKKFHPFMYEPDSQIKRNLTPGEQQALFDFKYYLKDDLLVKVDRASMYYGLECRCPFLDRDLISFSYALDVSLKKHKGVSKWLLKELLSEYLPKELVHRPKWGFSIPLSKWLRNDLRYLIDDFLSEECIEQAGLFDKEYVTKLKQDFLKGKDFLFNRVWVIIVIHKWIRQNEN
jgi:asparagine synthase (glutamine-hydrolysing)